MDKLDEAFLYSEAIDVTTYGRQCDKLREELTFVKIDHHTDAVDELDVEGIHRSKSSSSAAYGRGLTACGWRRPRNRTHRVVTEKLSAIFARIVRDTCLTADHFDESRRCFKALLIHVQAAVRVQVTGRGHHDPGDPTERRLAEALLAAVLEESFTLDRVRRDRVEHEVRRLHE
jgi:hypothetical protein